MIMGGDRMKTAENLVADLLKAVDTTEGKYVQLAKEDAVRIAELLVRVQFVGEVPDKQKGRILFYCSSCEKSFSAAGREDAESFEKWHYHTWYATCPWCQREVSQNDGYWR